MRSTVLNDSLPLFYLLILAMAGFVTIVTEALPAGLLPQLQSELNISASFAGQTITIYAIGSLLTAIPLTYLAQSIRRKPLLLLALLGFAIANTVTALSTSYYLMMVARFLAGVSAGLLWALLAGYAARMVSEPLKGRAITIAMLGTPLALSLGIPAGTFLGQIIGWRMTFGIMSIFAIILIVLGFFKLPDFDGQSTHNHLSLSKVFIIPGVRPILLSVFSFVLAHNILYTYITPFLSASNLVKQTDKMLLIFGCFSLFGIFMTGVLIDKHSRKLTLISITLFGLCAILLELMNYYAVLVYIAIAIWGISFGGVATLFQTALAKASSDMADVAQSMLVTIWNIAIAGGGIVGGLLLVNFNASIFPMVLLTLLFATFFIVWRAKKHGFP